jgi:site-specific DNA recombinase
LHICKFELKLIVVDIGGSAMIAYGYIRVSTEGQASDGVSLDAQRAKIEAWCVANDFQLRGLYTDAGISGKRSDNRPGLQQALEAVCKAKGVLVVYSLSRLARSTKDAITISDRLRRSGADLASLSEKIDTTSAAGKMVFRLLAVLAEFERDLVSERTSAALQHKKARGERVGQIPFGYRLAVDGVTLEPEPGEQAALAELQRYRKQGHSWQEIADTLNARSIPTKRGREWTWATARSVALHAAEPVN